jgi:hypothetical protein
MPNFLGPSDTHCVFIQGGFSFVNSKGNGLNLTNI